MSRCLQEAVLAEAVQAFRADFQEATRQAARLEAEVAAFFGRAGAGSDGGGGAGNAAGGAVVAEVGRAAACTLNILLYSQPSGSSQS